MAPSTGFGMTGDPSGVPRRAGGHAADRLREQLEREFGIDVPENSPDPADSADRPTADSDDAESAESDPGARARPDPGPQQGH